MVLKQVRKIKPTKRSVSGYIAYQGESLAYESTLERDFLLYHAFRTDVIDIVPQPISIPFIKNKREYHYTPDFFVQFKMAGFLIPQKSILVEVKPREDWQNNWRDWSEKWKAAIQYAKENDFKFQIFDESRIRHVALDNINFITSYRNLYVDRAETNAILQEIEMRGHTTVELILERFFKAPPYRQQGHRILWHLMANHLIGFDIWDDIKSEQLEVWHETYDE